MWSLPEANSTTVRDLMILSVSSLPFSVMVHSCHACVNLSRLRSRLPSHRRCALAGSPTPGKYISLLELLSYHPRTCIVSYQRADKTWNDAEEQNRLSLECASFHLGFSHQMVFAVGFLS